MVRARDGMVSMAYNNHSKPYKTHKTRYKTPRTPRAAPARGPPPRRPATHCGRYARAVRAAAGGLPKGLPPHPQDPKDGAGATPRHTALRRGEGGRSAEARSKGPPPPTQDPNGRRRCHPSPQLCATARRGRGRPVAYPRGCPHPLQVTPRPLRDRQGFEAGPVTHYAGKSNRLMCDRVM